MEAVGRLGTKEWKPWYNFSIRDGTLSDKVVECVYCKKKFSYVKRRCFQHYGWDQKTPSQICQKAPIAVKRKFQFCGGMVPKELSLEEMNGGRPSSSAPIQRPCTSASTHDTVFGGSEPDNNDRGEDPADCSVAPSRAGSNTTRSMRQQDMNEAYQIAKRRELDMLWASFFYEANVAFNVVRHPAFIKAVSSTASAGFDYTPPSYHAMRTTHIKARRKEIKAKIDERTKTSIDLYGATICSDGWDNVNRRPLMNVMLVCPAGDAFLGSVDTSGNKKTGAYIAREMKNYIEEVGPQNVAQICTDNASNMHGAMDDILREYPHMYKQGCCAHILDLLLEDWGKQRMVKDLVEKAKFVCNYIRRHHVTMALFRQFSPNLSLRVPAETRFACNYLMIHRLLRVKRALEQVVMAQPWYDFVDGLFNQAEGVRHHARAGMVRAIIRDDSFWIRCGNFVHMVEPVLVALRTFDGDHPAMGKAWLTMNNLKDHVYKLRDAPFLLEPAIATTFERQFDRRWDMMHTDLHYAAALLNPYLKTHPELKNIGEAKVALNRVLRKVGGQLGFSFAELVAEVTQYDEDRGPYSPEVAINIREANLEPHQWWQRVGGGGLAIIAKRILSLVCSASSCERNWSMYSFVHNKVRNRLGVEKSEDLVYIYTNSRFLRERPRANPLHWYENNVWSEESDPDGGDTSEGESDDDQYDMPDGDVPNGDDVWGNGADDGDRNEANDGDGNGGHDANHAGPGEGNDGVGAGDAFDFNNEPEYNQQNPNHNIFGDEVPPFPDFDDEADAEEGQEQNAPNVNPINGIPENNDRDVDSSSDDCDRNENDVGDDDDDNNDESDGNNGGGVRGPHWTGLATGEGNWGGFSRPGESGDVASREENQPRQGRRAVLAIPANRSTPMQPTGTVDNGLETNTSERLVGNSTISVGATIASLHRESCRMKTTTPLPQTNAVEGMAPNVNRDTVTPPSKGAIESEARRAPKRSRLEITGTRPSQENRCKKRMTSRTTTSETLPFHRGYTEIGPSTGTAVVGSRGISIDGITAMNKGGKERPMKRLVNTRVGSTGAISTQVRNITSEVEGEVLTPVGDEDLLQADNELSDSGDEDCDEAPSDEDVVVRNEVLPPTSRKKQPPRKKKARARSEE